MSTMEPSSALSSTPASASASARLSIHAVALMQAPQIWADNARVWFAQTEAQFAVRGLTCSLTKF